MDWVQMEKLSWITQFSTLSAADLVKQVGPEYQKIPAECRGHKLVYLVGKRDLPYEPGNVPYLTKPSITEQTVSISSSVM